MTFPLFSDYETTPPLKLTFLCVCTCPIIGFKREPCRPIKFQWSSSVRNKQNWATNQAALRTREGSDNSVNAVSQQVQGNGSEA